MEEEIFKNHDSDAKPKNLFQKLLYGQAFSDQSQNENTIVVSNEEDVMSSNTDGQSKLLKIIGIGQAEDQRESLMQYGEINYL